MDWSGSCSDCRSRPTACFNHHTHGKVAVTQSAEASGLVQGQALGKEHLRLNLRALQAPDRAAPAAEGAASWSVRLPTGSLRRHLPAHELRSPERLKPLLQRLASRIYHGALSLLRSSNARRRVAWKRVQRSRSRPKQTHGLLRRPAQGNAPIARAPADRAPCCTCQALRNRHRSLKLLVPDNSRLQRHVREKRRAHKPLGYSCRCSSAFQRKASRALKLSNHHIWSKLVAEFAPCSRCAEQAHRMRGLNLGAPLRIAPLETIARAA